MEKRKKDYKKEDSPEYLAKKKYYEKFITVFGKKTVSDLIDRHPEIRVERILVDQDNNSESLRRIVAKATAKKIPIKRMSREALTRISKSKDEDQGIVADVLGKIETDWLQFLESQEEHGVIMAVDGVTNPANLGMIVRSAAAAGVFGLLVPKEGVPSINQPILIKAAAGAVFSLPIFLHDNLPDALVLAQKQGFQIIGMSDEAGAPNLFQTSIPKKAIYVLGNESMGLSEPVRVLCHEFCSIPMSNGVESLNVAAAATLLAYRLGEHLK